MRRNVLTVLMAVLFAVLISTLVFAQPGGGNRQGGGPGNRQGGGPGGPGFGMGTGLLQNENVKKELKLSDDQVAQLTKVAEEMRAARPQQRQGGQGGGQGNRPTQEEMNQMRARMETTMNEMDAKVNKILSPEQQGKYKELRFQLSGGLNAPRLDVRALEVLNLTEDQKAKLKAAQDEQAEEIRKAMENRPQIDWQGLSQEEREKRGAELRAEGEARQKKFTDKVKGFLTADQIAKAEKLTAGAQETREKLGLPAPGQGRGAGGGAGAGQQGERVPDSWRPGQGGRQQGGNQQPRRAFPRSENNNQ
ncbi:MAG: Spy/CpxP family protein refolding chaperone [Planctomycetaceae bacterium]|nr:Spy/CpxP family protein refolding chaperone [Planctomycetaceae bacterium]